MNEIRSQISSPDIPKTWQSWKVETFLRNWSIMLRENLATFLFFSIENIFPNVWSGNTKEGSIIIPLTSCLTSLDKSVLQIKTKIVSFHTADSNPVKQYSTVILPPLAFPGLMFSSHLLIIPVRGTLTEGDGSVRLTSPLR
jgi:hypothetical protein